MEYETTFKKKTNTSSRNAEVPVRQDGQVGIRATLNNMGFSNDSIGYDDASGYVTLNGRSFMKPGYLDDEAGVSYANAGDIQKSVINFYRNTSNPVVRVSDAYAGAAGQYGLSADALTYGNGTVSIGGTPLDILYIDGEGKAWAWQNDVQNAVDAYANQTGVQTPMDLADEYARRYLSGAKNLADRLSRMEDFSYDPDTDPVFQAYQQKYRLEGDRASRNAVASYASLTGGYGNSAAATAAAQAGQYYAKQLTDTIPTLAQQAYDRYIEKYQTDLSLLDQMVDLYDTAYENAASANDRQRENANTSAKSNVERDQASYERNLRDWEKEWEERQNWQAFDQAGRDSYWNEVFNTQAVTQNNYQNEGLRLDNVQKQIYQQYYEQLLRAELAGSQLDNQLTQEQIKKLYMQNLLGLY
ncbi:hypothetical protein [Ructibacterium gallinarum]|uniref:Uncharacterized protein n=1 Tax=Ructibacterium gallinarum TaxID=2779355 RepID=A0A9D5M3A2_9FIRM|nr:hypothetical protein [Ructibacterium gallinarum]MBE5039884.1 hypothetical protein [Ructibacterium gallinarum]